jgi:hypothetical protein
MSKAIYGCQFFDTGQGPRCRPITLGGRDLTHTRIPCADPAFLIADGQDFEKQVVRAVGEHRVVAILDDDAIRRGRHRPPERLGTVPLRRLGQSREAVAVAAERNLLELAEEQREGLWCSWPLRSFQGDQGQGRREQKAQRHG